ncbi:MAG: SDR family NAD(P)-dependent oxidoreductase [Cyclobacteriaceae bacterium]
MVAVTGATGLLGSFIVKKFVSENIPVVAIKRVNSDLSQFEKTDGVEWRDADVTDSLSIAEAFKNVDTVIHAAALVSFDPRAKEKIYKINVDGTRQVVDECLKLGISRLIFISSVAALGRKKGQKEISEENQWTESDLNSDYAKSKYLAELEIFRGQEEGLNISIVNPSVILAPANANRSSAQVFKYVQQERKFYTDGDVNVVDVRDVAEIVFALYKKNLFGEKFIASNGQMSLKELMDEIAKRLGKKGPSIKIHPRLVQLAAWAEEIRCRITGAEALVSRQSVKTPGEKFLYLNAKSINRLQMSYRPLSETLDWCCEYYRKSFNANKSI